MVEATDTGREDAGPRHAGVGVIAAEICDWFVREVLPLEAALTQFLQHNWRNRGDIEDLLQEVYMRIFEAAQTQIPERPKAFVFTTARNLLIDRVRREQIIPIEAVADLDALNVAMDAPGPDRNAIARDELRRLQAALDRLPPRCRQAVILRQVDGLSRKQIASRMGIGEETVKEYLAEGVCALADMLYGETANVRRHP
ncbi:MAG TPA: RNA polymerase sigma factor [Rhizomicrobium sp.]|nr:RNA polymerase sigma factor [Rhizomicrobium sp.]